MTITLGITHYNRSTELKELLDHLGDLPENYDVLIVDDRSSEHEFRRLEKQLPMYPFHPRINIHRHLKNLGPGSAKNSLFEKSNHEYVFVLDSDNGVDNSTLQYLSNYQHENPQLDLIAPAAIHYFYKKFRTIDTTFHRSPSLANLITFLLGDEIYNNGNFLVSRRAWEKVGGYPVHHTLDTQGFGFRLRANGLAYSCVRYASYYHRRHKLWRRSQFLRTAQSGKLSHEQRAILKEFPDLLPPRLLHFIDNFKEESTNSWQNSLFAKLRRFLESDKNNHSERLLS
jgi:glycosyltransferase involved in cell wall biosynthesis